MKKSSTYDGQTTKYVRQLKLEEIVDIFAEIELSDNVLERIDCNANTFKLFRNLGGSLVEQPTIRECRKGLYAKIWTAEIWMNNKLKDGQMKLFYSKFETLDEPSVADEEDEPTPIKPKDYPILGG